MGTKTVTQNSSQQQDLTETGKKFELASSSPDIPSNVATPANSLLSGITNYLQKDPTATVTGPNNLQSSAFYKAQNLGSNASGWEKALGGASALIGQTAPQVANLSLSPAKAVGGTLGPATDASVTNATAANAGAATTYNPTTVSLGGYDASLLGDTSKYLPSTAATVKGASLLDGLDRYVNPATQALVDATMAKYDESAGQSRAQLEREAAGAGAFGGSGYGLALGQFDADTGRNRALTDAELRAAAFDRATTLSGQDADRRQGANVFNAGAQNTLDLARGQMGFEGARANQDATNTARQFTAGQVNTGLLAGMDAMNEAGRFNAGAANDFAITNSGYDQATRLANADAANAANRQNAQTRSNFDLSRFDAANDLAKFNTGQSNDMQSLWFSTANDNARKNADLTMANRQLGLDAAGQYADMLGAQSADQRANLTSMLDIGNQQWAMQDAEKNALLNQLKEAGGLLSPALIEALSGKTIATTGNTTNTSQGTVAGNKSETGSSGLGESLIGNGLGLLSLFALSERRLKRDIELVGRQPDGLGVYDFRYVWDDDAAPLRRGTMVDEVERLRPWALGPLVGGFRTVNYGAL